MACGVPKSRTTAGDVGKETRACLPRQRFPTALPEVLVDHGVNAPRRCPSWSLTTGPPPRMSTDRCRSSWSIDSSSTRRIGMGEGRRTPAGRVAGDGSAVQVCHRVRTLARVDRADRTWSAPGRRIGCVDEHVGDQANGGFGHALVPQDCSRQYPIMPCVWAPSSSRDSGSGSFASGARACATARSWISWTRQRANRRVRWAFAEGDDDAHVRCDADVHPQSLGPMSRPRRNSMPARTSRRYGVFVSGLAECPAPSGCGGSGPTCIAGQVFSRGDRPAEQD